MSGRYAEGISVSAERADVRQVAGDRAMSRLQQLRDAQARWLTEEGNAIRATGDDHLTIERAAALWQEAHEVQRGHADEDEWLEGER